MTSEDKFDGSRLALSVKEGDKSSFDFFVLKYHTLVMRFAYGITRDEEAAKDIAQNAFLKLWLTRDRIDESRSLKSYLFTIAKNETLNYLKKKKLRSPAPGADVLPDTNEYMDNATHADSQVLRAEIQSNLTETIAGMPEQRRKVFMMHRLDNLTSKEISAELGISERTVEKHIELALKDIRKSIN